MGSILPSQPVHHRILRSPLLPPRPSGELCRKAATRSSPVGETTLAFHAKPLRGNPAPCFFWDPWLPSPPPRFALPAPLPTASQGCPVPPASPGQCLLLSSPTALGCLLQTIPGLQGARGRMAVPLGPVGREKRDRWGASGWAHEPTRLPAAPTGSTLMAGMCVRMGSGGTCCALAAAHSPGGSCVYVCLSGRIVGREGEFGD